MGKRKLRACANCSGRHGPPTGKSCTRAEEVFVEKNKEMSTDFADGLEMPTTGLEPDHDCHEDAAERSEMTEWVLRTYGQIDGKYFGD